MTNSLVVLSAIPTSSTCPMIDLQTRATTRVSPSASTNMLEIYDHQRWTKLGTPRRQQTPLSVTGVNPTGYRSTSPTLSPMPVRHAGVWAFALTTEIPMELHPGNSRQTSFLEAARDALLVGSGPYRHRRLVISSHRRLLVSASWTGASPRRAPPTVQYSESCPALSFILRMAPVRTSYISLPHIMKTCIVASRRGSPR